MAESDEGREEIFVQPGEARVVRGRAVLRTVLGSCVGITFWARKIDAGALCHPMLPSYRQTAVRLSGAAGRRYVDFTIRDVAAKLDQMGAKRAETEVKLFGGADVLPSTQEARRPTVGRLNCEAALRVLQDEGFSVVASSLGGRTGVHIEFDTETGEVLLRRLGGTA